MATIMEGATVRITAYWTFVDKNDGESPDEEPVLVLVFWNKKKKEWTKFLEIDEVVSAIDKQGKAFIEVPHYTSLHFYTSYLTIYV